MPNARITTLQGSADRKFARAHVLAASEALALQRCNAMISPHDVLELYVSALYVSDFRFSICSRNVFAFSGTKASLNRIAFRNRDSFAVAAAAHRSAF